MSTSIIMGYAKGEQDSFARKEWPVKFRLRGHPTIMVDYGGTRHDAQPVSGEFRRVGHVALQIGYREEDFGVEDYLTDYSWHGVHIAHVSADLWKSSSTAGAISVKGWRFGLGRESGDGYASEDISIIPYRSSVYGWTRLHTEWGNAARDSATLLLYQNTFRFGQVGGMGVHAQFLPVIGFDASYERGAVFPRHLFFKHLVSVVVEELAHGIVSHFTARVMESSPAAAPVVGFLLHGGITYAIYELRKDDMHWPFKTSKPIVFDAFSLGVRLNL